MLFLQAKTKTGYFYTNLYKFILISFEINPERILFNQQNTFTTFSVQTKYCTVQIEKLTLGPKLCHMAKFFCPELTFRFVPCNISSLKEMFVNVFRWLKGMRSEFLILKDMRMNFYGNFPQDKI